MKTLVYIDGLNLYYALLRGTPFKWLDPFALFQQHVLGPTSSVHKVRYYTSPVKGSSSDDPESPQRQQRYLRALKTYLGELIDMRIPGTQLSPLQLGQREQPSRKHRRRAGHPPMRSVTPVPKPHHPRPQVDRHVVLPPTSQG